ncbi:MAG: signal peptidase II [Rhodospirillaceae bacterium]|nr:signal peptidase II [Rhodospirillaceae bacterium]|tara:strand:- start:8405 stop:8884 length:480 start_codon:yes stop_codon:yes gene_type:complete
MNIAPFHFGIIALLVGLLIDQVSKWWIIDVMMLEPRVIFVTNFFNLVIVTNHGISFGLFSNFGESIRWVLIGFAVSLSIFLFIWLIRTKVQHVALALGMIISGAIGNVIDRVRIGAVIDFLDFHAFGWHWPTFNVADSAITIGVLILMYNSLRFEHTGR